MSLLVSVHLCCDECGDTETDGSQNGFHLRKIGKARGWSRRKNIAQDKISDYCPNCTNLRERYPVFLAIAEHSLKEAGYKDYALEVWRSNWSHNIFYFKFSQLAPSQHKKLVEVRFHNEDWETKIWEDVSEEVEFWESPKEL